MNQNHSDKILSQVATYYSDKLAQYGQSPRGVDWNGEESQLLRFRQLCKIIDLPDQFSINDLGCGYGALYIFLREEYKSLEYSGMDISTSMIEAAKNHHQENSRVRFLVASEPDQAADFGIASGIFNVRLDRPKDEWQAYIDSTLDVLDKTSRLGFSFNCLTSYSDPDKMRDDLYYADPCKIFDFCKIRYSNEIALLHDYGLYEFTILVRKQR